VVHLCKIAQISVLLQACRVPYGAALCLDIVPVVQWAVCTLLVSVGGLLLFPYKANKKAWLFGSPQSLVKQLWGKDGTKDFLGLSHVESLL